MSAALRSDDWKARTFSLSVRDAAAVLGVSPRSVLDLMLTGELGFWMPPRVVSDRAGPPAEAARFDPVDVYAWRDARSPADVRESEAVLENLRVYLAGFAEPTVDYDAAVRLDMPLSVRGRVHVRVPVLTAFARARDAAPAAQLTDATMRTLTAAGAVQRRGLRPDGESRQRWATWLRLPEAVVAGGAPAPLGGFLTAVPSGIPSVLRPDPVRADPLPQDGAVWEE